MVGNALTPGRGFVDGPVRHRGRAARDGRLRRGQRGDRVGRAEDDPLRLRPRQHHRPRGHGAAHRHGLHRGAQDAAAGRLAVPALGLQPDPGDPRRARRRRRRALPQGRHQAGLRLPGRAVHRARRPDDAPARLVPGLQAGRRAAAGDAGQARAPGDRRRRVRRHGRDGDDRGHPRGDRRRDHRRVRRGEHRHHRAGGGPLPRLVAAPAGRAGRPLRPRAGRRGRRDRRRPDGQAAQQGADRRLAWSRSRGSSWWPSAPPAAGTASARSWPAGPRPTSRADDEPRTTSSAPRPPPGWSSTRRRRSRDRRAPAPPSAPTDPEDVKIITLARAALARTGAPQGACVRDTDGRTYAATSVALPHLQLSAVAVAVAMAVSSGAEGLEAVALAQRRADPSDDDLAVAADLAGTGRRALWHVDPRGQLRRKVDVRAREPEDRPGQLPSSGRRGVPVGLRLLRRPPERRQVDADQRPGGQQDRHRVVEAADHPARDPRHRPPRRTPSWC